MRQCGNVSHRCLTYRREPTRNASTDGACAINAFAINSSARSGSAVACGSRHNKGSSITAARI
eukprot:6038962-Lingulodinium_polyedra.AAC.1